MCGYEARRMVDDEVFSLYNLPSVNDTTGRGIIRDFFGCKSALPFLNFVFSSDWIWGHFLVARNH
jgi:hypothetical protein